MRERLATLRIRSAQRATRWALAGLDDPALKDLGVDRARSRRFPMMRAARGAAASRCRRLSLCDRAHGDAGGPVLRM